MNKECVICGAVFDTIYHTQKTCGGRNDAEILKEKYIDRRMSTTQLGDEFGVATTTISQWLRRHSIQARTVAEGTHLAERNELDLGDRQEQYLEGLILGDGSLVPRGVWSAMYGHSDSYEEYIEFLIRKLRNMGLKPRKDTLPESRVVQSGSKIFSLQTKPYPRLMELRKKWYPNGNKTIPPNFEISPNSLKNYYVGDGTLGDRSITIYTTFNISDIENIAGQIRDVGVECSVNEYDATVRFRKDEWRYRKVDLKIWKNSVNDFIKYLLSDDDTIPPGYGYKFSRV